MADSGWRTLSGRLGWLVAVSLFVSMAFYALKLFHVIVPLPEPLPPDASFVDNIIASFAHDQAHWIENLVSSVFLAVGFVGIAILGVAVRRALDRDDAWGAVLGVTFLVAGTLGAASQVLWMAASEVTTTPFYCDCGFLAEEIVSRKMIDDVVNNVQFWMLDASITLFAIGLLAFAATAARASWVPSGLAVYARVLAVLSLLNVIWDRVVLPVIDTGQGEIDFRLITGVVSVVLAGILIPVWAIWLAQAARTPTEPSEATAAPVAPPSTSD